MNFAFLIVSSLIFRVALAQNILATQTVSTNLLIATQEGVGFDAATELGKFKFVGSYLKAKNLPYNSDLSLENLMNVIRDKGLLSDFIDKTNLSLQKNPFPSAVAADGVHFYHFDGHHRSRAIREINLVIEKIAPEIQKEVMPTINILENFKGMPEEQIAQRFKEMRKGFVLPEHLKLIQADKDPNDALQIFKLWNKSINEVVDYPPRSLATRFFLKNKLVSEKYVDYVEFLFISEMPPEIINLKPGTPITSKLVEKLENEFFKDPRKVERLASWGRGDNHLAVMIEVELKHFNYRSNLKIIGGLSKEQDAIHEIFKIVNKLDVCH